MNIIKKLFLDFKSVFITEDVLKENEKHANLVTALTMSNLFFIVLVSWILSKTNIFTVEAINMTYVVINSFIGLFIPAGLCFLLRGEKNWLKYVLLGMFIFVLGTVDNNFSYTTAFLMVIPVLLSARYYKKNFTIFVSILTFAVFLIMSFFAGINYLDYLPLIISALLLYYVVVFACVQISQSGKNMLEKQKEITAKGTRIETELNLAGSIQKSMLPSAFPPFPEHDEVDIYALCVPAREVGGDFYDMFLIDDRYLVINVADVSGKGIPASLLMMVSKILIKNMAKIEKSASEIFNRVNRMLCEGNTEEFFVTSWLGILDLETGRLEFANAGHNPPAVYFHKRKKYEFLKTNPNIVLGCMDKIMYDVHEIYLEPGDKIFLYTDGVVEANNIRQELFGEKKLREYLDKNVNLEALEIVNGLKKEIDEFADGALQFDDITMLQVNYNKKLISKHKSISKIFKADLNLLGEVTKFVLDELKKYDINGKIVNQILLVVEEIFVNIAKYAYKDGNGECTITIYKDKNDIFRCMFEDMGIPFDPLKEDDPDLSVSSKDREVGGLGIYLSKNIMDDIRYEYKDKKNTLTIVKKIR